MNLIRSFFLCLVLIVSSQASFAQESVVKIGYFNLVKVMRSVPQAKQAEKRLEGEFAPRKSRIEGLDNELQKMKKDFEKESLVMSPSDQDAKKRELRNRQREFTLLLQEYEEDLSLRQNQETAALQKLVRSAVLEVAKEESYDLIIEQGAVIFASDKVDITSKVMERLAKL